MKGLKQFDKFDFEAFTKDKKLVVVGKSKWTEKDNPDVVLGSTIHLCIAVDKTRYEAINGVEITNVYEKLYVNISKDINIPLNSEVSIIGAKASISGKFKNNLWIVADDIKVVQK